jgi:flavin reductase (DIM6/NTAB) family NADH-FMN oxidoreductase RutF
MSFDSKKQRKIMGHFATGVTVVTTGGEAGQHGLTANAVASLSLDPPLVLVAVDKRAATLDYLNQNRCFAINILRLDQEEISRRFATPGPKDFSDLNTITAATDSPILADCLAFVDQLALTGFRSLLKGRGVSQHIEPARAIHCASRMGKGA